MPVTRVAQIPENQQKTVAQSTSDTEYIAISEAAHECMWLCMLTAVIGSDLHGVKSINGGVVQSITG
jgi:hypothetical protein